MELRNLLFIAFASVLVPLAIGCSSKSQPSVQTDESSPDSSSIIVTNEEEKEEKQVFGVDLGLSVNWAECNVGANSPEGIGYCIPFGNVTGTVKAPTSRRTRISGTDADIAVVKMGEGWRMPTGEEMQELLNKCTWEVETINGRNGFRVTGSNGNSIFLPNTGSNFSTEEFAKMNFKHDTSTNLEYEGNYWCGTPVEDYYGCNHLAIRTNKESAELMLCEQYFCNAVRAVHEK